MADATPKSSTRALTPRVERHPTITTGASSLHGLRHAQSISALQAVYGNRGPPISMEWEDVKFSVGDKEILKGCTGVIQPGVLTGVMGPSGSGKTTMMNVLSGRQSLSGRDRNTGQAVQFSGTMYACGAPVKPNYFLGKVAYVFQDHAIPMSETPYESFMFSAGLRLPRDVSQEEKEAYVESILKLLNLWNCKDNYIGSTTSKGLSGGEQKRTAVGVELISNPKLLFLDEPLSGLDSYNAQTLMETMKRLAESNVPVMMTVHQPSSEIFEMFTDIAMMHAGEVCYHGPASAMVKHWEQMNYRCPPFHNPSDFVMSKVQRARKEVIDGIKSSWATSEAAVALRGRFDECAHLVHENSSGEESSGSGSDDDNPLLDTPARRLGCCGAMLMLLARDFRTMKYEGKSYITTFSVGFLVAVMYGWFFVGKGTDDRNPHSAPNCLNDNFDKTTCQALFSAHVAVLSLVGVNVQMASVVLASELLQRERACYLREMAGGYYSVLPMFLARQCSEVIATAINSLLLLLGTYFIVGLQANFFFLFLEFNLMGIASASIMMFVSAGASSRETVQSLSILPQVIQFAFSGLLLPVSLIPRSLQWLKWICPLYYGLNIISLSEFNYVYKEEAACKANHGEGWREACPGTLTSLEVLEVRDVHEDGFWWPYVGVCLLLSVVMRFFAYILLVNKTRYAV